MAACFPDSGRLIRLNARSADFFHQQAAAGQRGVSDHLAVHAESWPARQQTVLRIFLDQLRRGSSRLLIGSRENDLSVEALHVPVMVAKIDGKPVEQLWMTRRSSHHAKILGCLDESRPENFRPHPIHDNTRGKRIVMTDGPFRERQTT